MDAGNFKGTPEQGFVLTNINPGSNKMNYNSGTAAGQDHYAISKNCKTPDRAMDLLNYFASYEGIELIINGVKGQTWDVVDGKNKVKKEIIAERTTSDAYAFWNKYGQGKYGHFVALTGPEINPNTNMPFNYEMSPEAIAENLKPYEKDAAEHYKLAYPGQDMGKREFNNYMKNVGAGMPALPEDLNAINVKVSNYVNDNWVRPIIAKTEADFVKAQEKFIKDLNDMGIQKILDKQLEDWKKVKAEMASLEK